MGFLSDMRRTKIAFALLRAEDGLIIVGCHEMTKARTKGSVDKSHSVVTYRSIVSPASRRNPKAPSLRARSSENKAWALGQGRPMDTMLNNAFHLCRVDFDGFRRQFRDQIPSRSPGSRRHCVSVYFCELWLLALHTRHEWSWHFACSSLRLLSLSLIMWAWQLGTDFGS